jgi:hypothetical protein
MMVTILQVATLGVIAQQSPSQMVLADEVQRLDVGGGGLGIRSPV